MNFPAQLPMPQRSNYQFTPENNIIRTQMVSGRAKQRLLFTSFPTYTELSWIFTSAEAIDFEEFFGQAGADWFNIDLLTPWGTGTHEARFIETPTGPKLVGAESWEYSAKVELRYRPIESQSSQ